MRKTQILKQLKSWHFFRFVFNYNSYNQKQ